jgi:predicted amidophosphoribosyltransferase
MAMTISPFVRRRLREGWAACAGFLFARTCAGCGCPDPAPAHDLCLSCQLLLERRPAGGCPRCGEFALPQQPCPDDHRRLVGLVLHRAPLRYRGTGACLVHRLKFSRDLAAGRYLARAMTHAIGAFARGEGRRALVVAVPRHKSKLRQERFDPAAWLAHRVALALHLVVAPHALCRTRPTLPQADPRVTNREANVADAFRCPAPWTVQRRTILLVDDVFTSGATARACARALLDAGANRVAALTGARA